MNNRAFPILFVFLGGLLFLTGTLWALSAEATPSAGEATAANADQRRAVASAVDWLVTTHQNDDGGYASFSTGANQAPSDVAGTLDALLAIAAGGYNPAAAYPDKATTPVLFLRNNVADVADFAASGGGFAGKVLLGLTVAQQNPRDFMGYNFVISLTTQLSPTGQYNAATPFNQALALQALAAVDVTAPLSATQWLKDQQSPGGSWDDGFGTADNADATAMAIMALVAQGEPLAGTALLDARDFLAASQLSTGGWEYGAGLGENANSTGLVVQALSALGEDFYSVGGPWDQNGNTPLSALFTFQSASGAFQSDFGSGPFDDFFATVQAVPGAAGRSYPLPARYEAARRAISCLSTLQDPATGGWEQFAGFGVNAAGTARAVEAIAAFGADPQSAQWTPGAVNAVDALEDLTPAYLAQGRGGRVGIVLQGVVAAGAPYTVTNFAGYNLPISVTGYLSPTGEYANTAFGPSAHNEAMLGLIAAGETPDPTAVAWLQNAIVDGSWGGADSDGSSINVLSRLEAAVPAGAFINLRATQGEDGGWGFGGPASVNSTAEVVLGLVQQGDNPFAPAWSVVVSGTIQNGADAILLQQGENGCWPNPFGPGDDPFATTDAILLTMADPRWPRQPSYLELNTYVPLIARQ